MLLDILEEYYFGTGGLVRAYSDALQGAIENASIIKKDLGYVARFTVSYADSEKIKYFFEQQKIRIINTEFNENVNFKIEIQKEKYNEILNNKNELKFKILQNHIVKEGYILI